MKLVEIRCPNCGGDLKVNPEMYKIVCEYCHTEFLVDDEIKRVETHHTYTDEAKIKKVELDKEIELKKLEMEEKKRDNEKRIVFVMIAISIVLGIIALVTWNDESMIDMGLIAVIAWMWLLYVNFKDGKNN